MIVVRSRQPLVLTHSTTAERGVREIVTMLQLSSSFGSSNNLVRYSPITRSIVLADNRWS